jgi:hypothetical protein
MNSTPTDLRERLREMVERLPAEYHKGGRLVVYRTSVLDLIATLPVEPETPKTCATWLVVTPFAVGGRLCVEVDAAGLPEAIAEAARRSPIGEASIKPVQPREAAR